MSRLVRTPRCSTGGVAPTTELPPVSRPGIGIAFLSCPSMESLCANSSATFLFETCVFELFVGIWFGFREPILNSEHAERQISNDPDRSVNPAAARIRRLPFRKAVRHGLSAGRSAPGLASGPRCGASGEAGGASASVFDLWFSSRLAREQNGNRTAAKDTFGDAPEKQSTNAARASCSDDKEIRPRGNHDVDEFAQRFADS